MISSTLITLFSILTFAFWLWMLIDAIKKPSLTSNERLIWILVIVFLPCIGSLIYFFVAKSK
jgi:hypothetical protein